MPAFFAAVRSGGSRCVLRGPTRRCRIVRTPLVLLDMNGRERRRTHHYLGRLWHVTKEFIHVLLGIGYAGVRFHLAGTVSYRYLYSILVQINSDAESAPRFAVLVLLGW